AQIISCDSARILGAGDTVTVTGIVTNGAELGSIRYLQDATGGMAAYSYTMSQNVARGDSLVVTGVLKDYNNLLEMDPIITYNVVSSGHSLPIPLVITPNQMGESLEAELVRINGAVISGGGGVFSGNTNYNFTANGQQGELRINNASSLVGQVIPVGTVNLVSICSQYSYYPNDTTSGYQLLMRDSNDIIATSSIVMTSPVMVSNIDTSGFTLNWTTNIAGSTNIYYGHTEYLELGVLSGSGTSTNHSISISGANASDLFYVKAFSVNGNDSAMSGTKAFITKSNSTGDIKVYFTRTVDHNVSTGVNAIQCDDALDDTLIAYINRAKYSIDVAIYNFTTANISNISTALNSAYTNGIDIRVIFDGTGTTNTGVQQLNSNIPKLASPNSSGYKIMHNKFVIIDGKSSDPNDPILWTGSMNFTETGINSYANNVVIIQDKSLVQAYILEFEEMWGDDSLTPDLQNSRFGPYKMDNTPHEFIVGGKRVECYFSPSDGVNGKIISTIETADNELLVETMLITRSDVAYAIRDVANSGVSSKVIVDNKSSCMPNGSTTVVNAIISGVGTDFKEYGESGILHHKLMIVDQNNPSADPLVWTGSHNWSSSADGENDENTIVIHDSTIANIYYQEFVNRFSLGTVIVGVIEQIIDFSHINVYPNPSSGNVNIEFFSSLTEELIVEIFDMEGSKVYNQQINVVQGENQIFLDLIKLKPGIYLLNFQTGMKDYSGKILLQ
ncbi:phospholipase D-like domain-containing protein, partial [candidate division KSB1 bacterium]